MSSPKNANVKREKSVVRCCLMKDPLICQAYLALLMEYITGRPETSYERAGEQQFKCSTGFKAPRDDDKPSVEDLAVFTRIADDTSAIAITCV